VHCNLPYSAIAVYVHIIYRTRGDCMVHGFVRIRIAWTQFRGFRLVRTCHQ